MEILIAEDDNKLLNLLINILSTLGHTVLTAQDGKEAWHIYQSKSIHMVNNGLDDAANGMDWSCAGIFARHPGIIILTSLSSRVKNRKMICWKS